MRRIITAAAALTACSFLQAALAQPSVAERLAEVRAKQARKDPRRATLEKLMTAVTVDLKDVRLEDALTFIAQVGDIDMEIAWRTDTLDGLDRDARVSASAKGQDLLGLLETLLDRVGAASGAGSGANTWQLGRSGQLEIGPKARLNKQSFLKIYDIRDMVFVQPDFPNVPELNLDSVLQQSSQRGGGGGGGGIFNQREQNTTEQILRDEQQRAEDIVTIIVQNVEPEQWDRNGGDGATIRLKDNLLLIKAPDYIHRQIMGYPFWPGR